MVLQQHYTPYPAPPCSFDIPAPSALSLPDGSAPLWYSTESTDEIATYMRYEEGASRWLCLKCNKSNPRRNRLRDHVAKCLGYKLYLCGGRCGVGSWYGPLLFDPCGRVRELRICFVGSHLEFRTRQNLKDHRNPQRRTCAEWYAPWPPCRCWVVAHPDRAVARRCGGRTSSAT